MATTHHRLIIIGSGPAGLTAAIYSARANLKPLLIEGTQPGGQLMGTTAVENWPGNISIMGPKLMMNIKDHAKHFGTQFVSEDVVKVDFSQRPFTLWTSENKEFTADAVIVATGARANRLKCQGEDEYWGKGVTTCAVCDGAFYPNKNVIIVGGGDTAMEDASFMTKFTDKITIVQNMDKLTASYAMQQRVLNNPNITIIYNSSVTAVHGDGNHITHVTITDVTSQESRDLPADVMFLAIGLKPNTDIFKGQLALSSYGYLNITNQTNTSVAGVFAAGDVADFRYRQAIVSSGAGCMAALDAERYLSHQS